MLCSNQARELRCAHRHWLHWQQLGCFTWSFPKNHDGLDDELNRLERGTVQGTSNVYASLLRNCTNLKALSHGKRLHEHMISNGYGRHLFLGNLLVQMYSKCGNLEQAREVFDRMPSRNEFSWSIMISAYAQHSPQEVIELYQQMPYWGIQPDGFIFASIISACSSLGDLAEGKAIHARIEASEFRYDAVVQTALVSMYVKCGSLHDARRVLEGMPEKDVFSWTAMVVGYTQHGCAREAIELYRRMDLEGIELDAFTFASVLAACSSLGDLKQGKITHDRVVSLGLHSDVVVQNALVNMYAKCGSLKDARMVFEEIRHKNVRSWTSIVAAYAQQGHHREALQLYHQMGLEGVEPDDVTYVSVLGACSSLAEGERIHARIIRSGVQSEDVDTALVNLYASFGSMDAANRVFDKMPRKNVVCCTSMIAAYAEQGCNSKAIQLYRKMVSDGVEPNDITFATVLSACSTVEEAKEIHADITAKNWRSGELVGAALVDTYAKCGSLEDARSVFASWQLRDTVSWNVMIGAYTQSGHDEDAIVLYHRMALEGVAPDSFSYSSILSACSNLSDLEEGKAIHARIVASGFDSSVVVQNAIVNMYAKCGSLDDARKAFDVMERRDVVSWSSMIGGYAQTGHSAEALALYRRMDLEPNGTTFASVLDACSSLGELQEAKAVHARFLSSGLQSDVVDTTLVNMYAKCGFVEDARLLFEKTPQRDSISWNAMIAAYAQHGDDAEVVELYRKMNLEGSEANHVTFVSILIACSQAGLLEECCKYFTSMVSDHRVEPIGEHYVCIVDLLGRSGRLNEAEEVIESMPVQPDAATWRTLLGACKIHNDTGRALRIAEGVFKLNPGDSAAMVLLSNIHAGLGETRCPSSFKE